jgi:hypothetical protein
LALNSHLSLYLYWASPFSPFALPPSP